MQALLLRLDAPLMSFGAPTVDNRGVIQPYPALSMLTGLLANALGWDHAEFQRLNRLQERLQYGCRQDRRGAEIRDFQTVDFGRPHFREDHAWTTRGALDARSKRLASQTHLRLRDYWADAAYTLAVNLVPTDEQPSFDAIAYALQAPARPLFLGRKACLPAAPIYLDLITADSLRDALARAPLCDRADPGPTYPAWWSTDTQDDPHATLCSPVTDRRDWRNQIHVGERWVASGSVSLTHGDHDD